MTVYLQEKVPLAWVNQSLFDYQDHLRSGTVTLPCWNVNPEEPLEDLLNPIGQNANTMYMGWAWASPICTCTPYSIVYGVTVTLCIYLMCPILVIKHRSKHQSNLVPRPTPLQAALSGCMIIAIICHCLPPVWWSSPLLMYYLLTAFKLRPTPLQAFHDSSCVVSFIGYNNII